MNWNLDPKDVFSASPVIPVMVIKKLEDALPMAKALQAGGINVFEITLRSAVALDAIKLLSKEVPDALVGAGTVLSAEQYDQAVAAGAKFVISPGATPALYKTRCSARSSINSRYGNAIRNDASVRVRIFLC